MATYWEYFLVTLVHLIIFFMHLELNFGFLLYSVSFLWQCFPSFTVFYFYFLDTSRFCLSAFAAVIFGRLLLLSDQPSAHRFWIGVEVQINGTVLVQFQAQAKQSYGSSSGGGRDLS